MTVTNSYDVTTIDGVVDQVIARNEDEAIALWRDRWDEADGPMPEIFLVKQSSR